MVSIIAANAPLIGLLGGGVAGLATGVVAGKQAWDKAHELRDHNTLEAFGIAMAPFAISLTGFGVLKGGAIGITAGSFAVGGTLGAALGAQLAKPATARS